MEKNLLAKREKSVLPKISFAEFPEEPCQLTAKEQKTIKKRFHKIEVDELEKLKRRSVIISADRIYFQWGKDLLNLEGPVIYGTVTNVLRDDMPMIEGYYLVCDHRICECFGYEDAREMAKLMDKEYKANAHHYFSFQEMIRRLEIFKAAMNGTEPRREFELGTIEELVTIND